MHSLEKAAAQRSHPRVLFSTLLAVSFGGILAEARLLAVPRKCIVTGALGSLPLLASMFQLPWKVLAAVSHLLSERKRVSEKLDAIGGLKVAPSV